MQKKKESKINLEVGQYLFVGTDPLMSRGWITKVTSLKDPSPFSRRGFRCLGILLYYRIIDGQKLSFDTQFFSYPTNILYQLEGDRYLRSATNTEIRWLDACIEQNKLVEKPLSYLRKFLNHKNWT